MSAKSPLLILWHPDEGPKGTRPKVYRPSEVTGIISDSDYLEGKLELTDNKCLVVNGGYSTNNIRHLVDQDYK